MMGRLRAAWDARAPRARAIVVTLACLCLLALYLWLLQAATEERGQLQAQVASLRAQSLRFDRAARDYARLQSMPGATGTATDLHSLVQARVDAAGLGRALVRLDANDDGRVVLDFAAVGFADWLDWVGGLAAQQVRLSTCRIEALSAPGLISVTATLVRADRP